MKKVPLFAQWCQKTGLCFSSMVEPIQKPASVFQMTVNGNKHKNFKVRIVCVKSRQLPTIELVTLFYTVYSVSYFNIGNKHKLKLIATLSTLV